MFKRINHVHFIGIGGIGMSGLAEVLIDLGLPPTIAVGQPFPQHQVKGINEYRKTISIETEVSAAHAQDLGKVLGLSSSKAAKLVSVCKK